MRPYKYEIQLELTETNPPEKDGYEYGYAIIEPLPDIHKYSSKHTHISPIDISNINTTNGSNVQNENVDNNEIHL